MRNNKISPFFNFKSRGRKLGDFTLTLTLPTGDPQTQAEDFSARLTAWLARQSEDFKGNAEAPAIAAPTADGNARLTLRCTEDAMARIERQFAGDILRVDPPARHACGAIYPPKVDPWDISKW